MAAISGIPTRRMAEVIRLVLAEHGYSESLRIQYYEHRQTWTVYGYDHRGKSPLITGWDRRMQEELG